MDDIWQRSLYRDFALGRLRSVCAAHGVEGTVLVLMPVTDRHIEVRERALPGWRYRELRAAVAERAAAALGLTVIDVGEPRTDYAHFADSYHLNAAGRPIFTGELGAALRRVGEASGPAEVR